MGDLARFKVEFGMLKCSAQKAIVKIYRFFAQVIAFAKCLPLGLGFSYSWRQKPMNDMTFSILSIKIGDGFVGLQASVMRRNGILS